PFAAGFALLFHPSGSDADSVLLAAEQAAEDALVPLVGTTWRWLLHTPAEQGGFMLEGRGLVERAIMPVPGGVHLRCVNLFDSAVGGRWRIPAGAELAGAMRVRLDGTPIAALQV